MALEEKSRRGQRFRKLVFLTTVLELVRSRLASSSANLRPFSFFPVTLSGSKLTIFFLLISCTTMVSGMLSPELQRLNYGVVFDAQTQVQLSKEIWVHTFEIQLPEDISMIKLSGCCRDVEKCSVENNVLLEMTQIRQEAEVILNNTLSAIAKLVPER